VEQEGIRLTGETGMGLTQGAQAVLRLSLAPKPALAQFVEEPLHPRR
jgi:hypothetical protein